MHSAAVQVHASGSTRKEKLMRTLLRAISLAAVLTFATTALADDDDVALEALPAAVRATVDREVNGGQILEIERDHDRKNQRIVYEVEFLLEGVKYELDIAEDGTLVRRHRD
jgi:hypothetical protein